MQMMGYGATFYNLTKQKFENDPEWYETNLLFILLDVGINEGMKASTIRKPTKNGTYINFNVFKSQDDANKYEQKLFEMSNEIKRKYGKEIIKRKEK